ncbi:hypothetical protein GQ472_01800 [archaeon]|nr:hypothetical protein [archaeon]
MGFLTSYLQFWDTLWYIMFSGMVKIANIITFSPELAPLNVIGQPTPILAPSGEFQISVYFFMTFILHFIVLVALMDKGKR